MNLLADAARDFQRRLDLVRRIAQINAQRTQFSRDEEAQFIVAARLFTQAELQAMHRDALAAAGRIPPPA